MQGGNYPKSQGPLNRPFKFSPDMEEVELRWPAGVVDDMRRQSNSRRWQQWLGVAVGEESSQQWVGVGGWGREEKETAAGGGSGWGNDEKESVVGGDNGYDWRLGKRGSASESKW